MDNSLHYLIMANQMLVQKALLDKLKDTGLTIARTNDSPGSITTSARTSIYTPKPSTIQPISRAINLIK